MIEELGKFHLEFPLWFLSEKPARGDEGTNAMGIRGETGFLMLPLFTEEELAQRFVEDDQMENGVITTIGNRQQFVSLLKEFSKDFAYVCFNPPTRRSGLQARPSIPVEYVLRRMEENRN
jgi:hypothetical protein